MAEIVICGEALVEVMRTEIDVPLDRPGGLVGPFPSGAPAISASQAARLGAEVAFVGCVGDDAFGDCVQRRLEADGVNCRGLRRHPERLTGIAFVSYRSDGSRSFVFHMRDAAAAQVTPEQIDDELLTGVRWVHVMGSSLSAGEGLRQACYQLVARVVQRGGRVSLDPNLRPELLPPDQIRSVCEPVLAVASVVMPSGPELLTLSGCATPDEGAEALLSRGVELIALKQGERGSSLFTAQGRLDIPAYRVTEVDPTGAGDCYDAALLVGLLRGWPLAQAGLLANAAGALATTRQGPMEGAMPLAQVQAFMASQGRPLAI
ncbi:MAG: sugar kinase [Anaerolineales bacterium]